MAEWISVKDRLPERNIPKNPLECEESKEFLVFTSEKAIRMGYFHQGKMKIMSSPLGEPTKERLNER